MICCSVCARAQVGTWLYMAPEMIEGAVLPYRESFLCCDVYSLALILWEMFARTNALPSCTLTDVIILYTLYSVAVRPRDCPTTPTPQPRPQHVKYKVHSRLVVYEYILLRHSNFIISNNIRVSSIRNYYLQYSMCARDKCTMIIRVYSCSECTRLHSTVNCNLMNYWSELFGLPLKSRPRRSTTCPTRRSSAASRRPRSTTCASRSSNRTCARRFGASGTSTPSPCRSSSSSRAAGIRTRRSGSRRAPSRRASMPSTRSCSWTTRRSLSRAPPPPPPPTGRRRRHRTRSRRSTRLSPTAPPRTPSGPTRTARRATTWARRATRRRRRCRRRTPRSAAATTSSSRAFTRSTRHISPRRWPTAPWVRAIAAAAAPSLTRHSHKHKHKANAKAKACRCHPQCP